MSTIKRRNRSRFGRALLIYVIAFLLIAVIALGFFYWFLSAFESSRVTTCVQRYIESCEKELTYSWGIALGGLDTHMEGSASDNRKWAQEKLSNAAVRELISGSGSEKLFGLFDEEGNCFETLTLTQSGKSHWGFTDWIVVNEQISLEAFTTFVSLVIPENYSVGLGKSILDNTSIIENNISYDLLEPFENYVKPAPKKVRYQIGPLLSQEELTVYDEKGQVVTEEQQTEYYYLNNCTEKEKARLEVFASRYLSLYLPYAGDLNRSGMAYYWDLHQMIVHGGDLEMRIQQAQAGFGYGNTMQLDILSLDFNCFSNLGGGHYLTDFSYRIRTVGLHGPVEEDYLMRLLIREDNNTLYVEAMYLS